MYVLVYVNMYVRTNVCISCYVCYVSYVWYVCFVCYAMLCNGM